ncbi:hypothetical protein MTER_37260 [Mycolicibacter terrae]|uniref:Uncharacterized protein n=2 Tax=Mycolicibacter terrae TaxID=1788 RepID=A0AAD1I0V7_9MYCO|nr:hypothetical protein MTER_37260 [Mycolicibacter terrae]SNV54408.1 Uncharacterised protein [Mycolicibacter terrae]
MADYDYRGGGDYGEPAGYYSQYREPTGVQPGWSEPPEPPPTPWYLQPLALIGWGVLTALLIAGLVWGMVRLVNKESGDATPTTVTSTTVAPNESPVAPNPEPVVPETTTGENAPPATTIEPSASSSEPPSTTESPTTTTPTTTSAPTTTEAPTTTAPTTTQAPTTTSAAAQPPSEIVIPLPHEG